jgi:hypothetical protein
MEKPKKPEELPKRLLFKKTTFGRYCLLMVANFGRGRMLRHSRSLSTLLAKDAERVGYK